MIYYQKDDVIIRNLIYDDCEKIAYEERLQGWDQDADKYYMRLKDASLGKCTSLVLEYKKEPSGYINVYSFPKDGPFYGSGYPEIKDFGVLAKYRNRGFGTLLMNAAENIANNVSDHVVLGVGLHSGYGSAQRMYVKRGYIFDGSGVWYNGRVADQYASIVNDDDLVLYMIKKL